MFDTTPLQAIGSNLVVKRSAADVRTPGGVVLPDAVQRQPHEGVVLTTGEGRRSSDGSLIPLTLQAGDRIVFGRHAGNEVTFEGRDYLIMDESQVLARIDG